MDEPFQLVLCNASEALSKSLERFSADRWAVQWRHDAGSLQELFQPSVRGESARILASRAVGWRFLAV